VSYNCGSAEYIRSFRCILKTEMFDCIQLMWTVCLVSYHHAPLIHLWHIALYKFVWLIADVEDYRWRVCGFIFSLFPTMPRHNLVKAAPMVEAFCRKHGLDYQNKPLLTAFADIIRWLFYNDNSSIHVSVVLNVVTSEAVAA